ncbi:MAG: hypothetical protein K0Q51_654 [Rickettsiaceae bacterium]|jgi:hypothetical protein|nr:hypothetical protein [Rickettsiaceae bacterium]
MLKETNTHNSEEPFKVIAYNIFAGDLFVSGSLSGYFLLQAVQEYMNSRMSTSEAIQFTSIFFAGTIMGIGGSIYCLLETYPEAFEAAQQYLGEVTEFFIS